MKRLDQDDVVIAVGLGLLAGSLSAVHVALSLAFVGLCYVALGVVLGRWVS